MLLVSGNRATAMFGGWLAVIAGAWFVVGRTLASTLRLGDIGHPLAGTDAKRAAIEIASFSGLGALIVFLGGAVLARVTVRTARDVELRAQGRAGALDGMTFDAFDSTRGSNRGTDPLSRGGTGARARVACSVGRAARRATDDLVLTR